MVSPDREHSADIEILQYTNEEFLDKLYGSIAEQWKDGRNAEVVEEFFEQYQDNWNSHESLPGRISNFTADIKKGMLLKNNKFDFGLAIVECARTSYDRGNTRRLQFGGFPRIEAPGYKLLSPIMRLRCIVNTPLSGSGEIYEEDMLMNRLRIDCWADKKLYGGLEVGRWPQEKLLTDAGIESCVGLVNRTIDRAFA